MSNIKIKAVTILAAGLSVFVGATTFAETTPATSTTTAQNVAPRLVDKISMSYLGVFYGPAINHLSSYQPLSEGGDDLDSPQMLESLLNTGYKLNDKVTAGVGVAFWYRPIMGDEFRTSHQTEGAFVMKDPFLKVSHSKVLSRGNLNIAGDLRAYVPATEPSRKANLITGLRSTQATNYQIPDSRWSFGADSMIRANIFGSNASATAKDLVLYFGPHVDFQINPKLSTTLLYEVNGFHKKGESLLSINNGGTDIASGLNWDVSPRVSISPFLNMYPTSLRLSSTSLNVVLTAKLL